ncbi:transcription intermediary factor 1-alpha-like [Mercenaria mercenaria]|uniref:transcription intermediary factor 1-alpha-like n=1 Tax=Mercenaria mercenaria TaxID=6596 RepID=UPI00234F1880|nr:transcription intermediary factor 1-alpha-like [Mercenaria mercenaria]XP_053391386.1 transcription intermediary factor 1-alpha-like [Mercenaria mercenaria]XP_053391387.1 transcription intermediary factor 1-alpha-like [Mercenaria mercenaria]
MAVPGKKASKKLSSTLSRGSEEDFEVFCQPCDRDDLRLPAAGYCVDCEEHLCDSCFNTHRRPKPLRHHKLLDKDNMPHTQNLSTMCSSTTVGQPDDLTSPCSKHKKETIKFYCHDHKALLCSVCVTLDHPCTSCQVNYIPDISRHTIDSTEFKDTLKELDKITKKCQKITADLRQMVAKSNTSLTDVLAEIAKFRKEINQRLDELEKEASDAANALKQENDTKLKTTEETCDNVSKSLKASSDMIKQLNTTKKADRLFTELKNADQLIRDCEKRMSQVKTTGITKEYTFDPSEAIQTFLQNEKSLGTLNAKTLEQPSPSSTPDSKSRTVSNHKNICVKTSSDKKDCYITGIAASFPNQVFLVDNTNYTIKMVDINSQSIQNLSLDSWPYHVIPTTRDELAVTLPSNNTIQLMSYSSNRLSKKNTLEVDGRCYGISYCQGKLAVTFIGPAKLQIMDLKGTVLTTVIANSNGENIFGRPEYVTSSSKSIYVSDRGMFAVIWLNWQGELMGSYGGMGFPQGIAMSDDGSFYVSDIQKGQCNILNVTGDCKESTTVLKDLDHPRAIYWCDTTKTFYVSNYSDDEKERNIIKIFKMS